MIFLQATVATLTVLLIGTLIYYTPLTPQVVLKTGIILLAVCAILLLTGGKL